MSKDLPPWHKKTRQKTLDEVLDEALNLCENQADSLSDEFSYKFWAKVGDALQLAREEIASLRGSLQAESQADVPPRDDENANVRMYKALNVVVLTDHIHGYLLEHDPMALGQVQDAIRAKDREGPDVVASLVTIDARHKATDRKVKFSVVATHVVGQDPTEVALQANDFSGLDEVLIKAEPLATEKCFQVVPTRD